MQFEQLTALSEAEEQYASTFFDLCCGGASNVSPFLFLFFYREVDLTCPQVGSVKCSRRKSSVCFS